MVKYNITEIKEKEAAYRTLVSPKVMDEMKGKILDIILSRNDIKTRTIRLKNWRKNLARIRAMSLPWSM